MTAWNKNKKTLKNAFHRVTFQPLRIQHKMYAWKNRIN